MKAQLKQIKLTYFKGIKDLEVSFDKETNIHGDNGTGKTTLFDAFTWLLFGKDHNDNQKFEIKTLDSNNNAIEKIDHEVEGVLLVDNEEITIKRIYREKWVKRRGTTEAELAGHETVYFWNEVPLSQKEFQIKVSSVIDEKIFKLVTNPLYFNAMKWQDRRALISEIAGAITDEEIVNNSADFKALLEKLSNKTLAEYKKEVASKKKKVKTELDQIPTRIDELQKSIPEAQNWDEIEKEISDRQTEVASIEEQLQDQSKVSASHYKEIEQKQSELHILKNKKADFEWQASDAFSKKLREKDTKINEIKSRLNKADLNGSNIDDKISNLQSTLTDNENSIIDLRNEFAKERDKQLEIDEHQFICPTCNRAFEDADIEAKKAEITENFNNNKANSQAEINKKGKALKVKNEEISKEIETLLKEKEENATLIDSIKKELADAENTQMGVQSTQAILKDNAEYQECLVSIKALEDEIKAKEESKPVVDDEAVKRLKLRKSDLIMKIDALKSSLNTRTQIEQANKRIAELETQSKTLAQQLADLESEEFTITAFASAKINKIEEKINELFPTVRFKMFEEQINGGVAETCQTLINGVPFSDANNAAKIQAGIEIINVLSKHYNFYAPIFIDNAESVTTLPATENQIIRLVVEEGTKVLTIK